MKAPQMGSLQTVSSPFLRTLLVRVTMLVLFAASVALVWCSVSLRLLPVIEEGKQKAAEVSTLANEVQKLEANWDLIEAERTEAHYWASKALLFYGLDECTNWQKEFQAQAVALGFEENLQQGEAKPHPRSAHKLSLVPAEIDLQSMLDSPATNSPYKRLMNLTGILPKTKQRIDLVELVVVGNSNSVDKAKAVVQFWSQEPALK